LKCEPRFRSILSGKQFLLRGQPAGGRNRLLAQVLPRDGPKTEFNGIGGLVNLHSDLCWVAPARLPSMVRPQFTPSWGRFFEGAVLWDRVDCEPT
jgi:hypothetical protein